MEWKEKLIKCLKTWSKDFTFDKAGTLLRLLTYVRSNKGRTSGSRISFTSPEHQTKILLHKPHPGNVLKRYQIDQLLEILEQEHLL